LDEGTTGVPPALVPIRDIGPRYRSRIAAHLIGLDADDRYLRFGYPATDEQIERYVAGLDFDKDEVFGIYNRRLELIALAHLAYPRLSPASAHGADGLPESVEIPASPHVLADVASVASMAEFGVSVVRRARGKGYGARLFEHAVLHARNAGVAQMMIHALTENAAMLHIARKAGARMRRDGSESEAYLMLPPADLESRLSEIVASRMGEVDYRLKRQAKQFWDVIGGIQEIRRGVREGRHRASQ
jgi:GNAT superfamily N-acetyltransferase